MIKNSKKVRRFAEGDEVKASPKSTPLRLAGKNYSYEPEPIQRQLSPADEATAKKSMKDASDARKNYKEAESETRQRASDGKNQGGAIKKYASGGSIRGGGIEQRGKTKGRFV